MQKSTQRGDPLTDFNTARHSVLRTYRRDGTEVDTPIWFDVQGGSVVFRTKIGPTTKRLAARAEVELPACDYRGRALTDATTFVGRATILAGVEAAEANRGLH